MIRRLFSSCILTCMAAYFACAPHSVQSVATKQVAIDTAADDASDAADCREDAINPPTVVSLPTPVPSTAEQMLSVNNEIRAAAGKPPQTLDERLCRAAQDQATWLGDHGYAPFHPQSGHYFGNGDVESRTAKQGFRGSLGENLGVGYSSVQHGFQCFKDSAGHYRTLLGNYDLCGFGEGFNRAGQRIYVCVYGTESSQVAAAAPPAPVYPVPTRLGGHYEQRSVKVGLGRWQTQTVWVSDQPAYQPTRFQNVGTCSGGRCR